MSFRKWWLPSPTQSPPSTESLTRSLSTHRIVVSHSLSDKRKINTDGMGWLWRRRIRPRAVVLDGATAFLLLFLFVFSSGNNDVSILKRADYHTLSSGGGRGDDHKTSPFSPARKMLVGRSLTMVEPDRIWGDKCTSADIVINQGPTSPLPTGIPSYTVEIVNACVTGCDISEIHLSCGWFSSARLINPKIFKRLRYNDCLVNDGKALVNGGTLSFEYANTYLYPLTVSKVICA